MRKQDLVSNKNRNFPFSGIILINYSDDANSHNICLYKIISAVGSNACILQHITKLSLSTEYCLHIRHDSIIASLLKENMHVGCFPYQFFKLDIYLLYFKF